MAALDALLSGGPRVLAAPMVRGSELAFRMLARHHGIRLCYAPMLKAEQLVAGGAEERGLLEACASDRPLVVQLAGRDPCTIERAARIVLEALDVDAFDLNLGCPQECARKGGYGAFLQEEPATAAACIRALCAAAEGLPVFCKMRILGLVEGSIAFARCLEEAGCAALAVHCRQRAAKHDGLPDYAHLAEVVSALGIPVVVNGGIGSWEQAEEAMVRTGAAAAMAGSALLRCPRAFSRLAEVPPGGHVAADMALEYLDFAERFPPPSLLYVRKHLRWLFRAELQQSYVAAREAWLEGRGVDHADWRTSVWTFLEQPYMKELWQFRELVHFIAHHQGLPLGPQGHPRPLSLREIRSGQRPEVEDEEAVAEFDWSLDFG